MNALKLMDLYRITVASSVPVSDSHLSSLGDLITP